MSDVKNFAYLRRYLEGQANSTIAGLSLTATNYQSAIDLLKKRAIQRTYANDLTHLPAALDKETHKDCGNYIPAAQLTSAL